MRVTVAVWICAGRVKRSPALLVSVAVGTFASSAVRNVRTKLLALFATLAIKDCVGHAKRAQAKVSRPVIVALEAFASHAQAKAIPNKLARVGTYLVVMGAIEVCATLVIRHNLASSSQFATLATTAFVSGAKNPRAVARVFLLATFAATACARIVGRRRAGASFLATLAIGVCAPRAGPKTEPRPTGRAYHHARLVVGVVATIAKTSTRANVYRVVIAAIGAFARSVKLQVNNSPSQFHVMVVTAACVSHAKKHAQLVVPAYHIVMLAITACARDAVSTGISFLAMLVISKSAKSALRKATIL
mmetsp:Transcript_67685/g.220371  ORF Transcript_67685/g.220371 Transcript_67685/m.220371 type:complete len:304 (+) Transcript_67685:631-1542(+)